MAQAVGDVRDVFRVFLPSGSENSLKKQVKELVGPLSLYNPPVRRSTTLGKVICNYF